MLIRDTRDLLNEHFVCSSVISIPRACNGIAHNLAKLAMCWDPGGRHVWALPEFVKTLIARDYGSNNKAIEPVIALKKGLFGCFSFFFPRRSPY